MADQPGDLLQLGEGQGEGVGPHQEHPPHLGAALQSPQLQPGLVDAAQFHLGLQQVGFHLLHGGKAEPEGEVVVEGAELAAVVGAARRHLDEQRTRLVGRPPDGAGVVHKDNSFFDFFLSL